MRKLDRKEYDTVDGIAGLLKYYPHFHAVIEAREQAGKRGERLNEFVVLQAFVLDSFGQVGKFNPNMKEIAADLPQCTSKEVFIEALELRLPTDKTWGITLTPVYIPPTYVRCAGCGKYYSVHDCHDVVPLVEQEVFLSLSGFIGRQLWEVRYHLNSRHDAYYFIHPSIQVRNDRFIDPRLDPYYESNSPLNRRGWLGDEDGIGDWYVIQLGDETSYNKTQYFHAVCFEKWVTEKTRKEFEEVFRAADVEIMSMEAVPNEYGSYEYRGPWFRVLTSVGQLRIGWRKRVIEICLEGGSPGEDCREMIQGEETTITEKYVHAWDHEKAAEYIGKIASARRQAEPV